MGVRPRGGRHDPLGAHARRCRAASGADLVALPEMRARILAASIFVTWVTSSYSLADFNKLAGPALVGPIKDLRTWAFIFCFLSIGLTTRFRELARAGTKPFVAFTAGVAVNVVLGFLLSASCLPPIGPHSAADPTMDSPEDRRD
jgi:hypothetical protein